MGKYRRIPTISGSAPPDPFFDAEFASDEEDCVLDLHGLTIAEARSAIDLFLDRMVVGDRRAVKIIHGKGTGALAELVAKTLRTDARIAESRPSHRQGEAAVVALLKSG